MSEAPFYDSIDQEWADAEEAIKPYQIRSLVRTPGTRDEFEWEAVAQRPGDQHIRVGRGHTPASAIMSLYIAREGPPRHTPIPEVTT